MRVLLAEDDFRLGSLIKNLLLKNNIQVDWVLNGEAAYDYALQGAYDVIVLDWLMPIMTGIDACAKLRQDGYQGAILMLTAKDAVGDKVQGLDKGADDYVVKPFEFAELLARLRALSRRSLSVLKSDALSFGDFKLNHISQQVFNKEREITLSRREFQLLELLARNCNITVKREVILDRVWGLETEVTPNTLDAYIYLLRKKLGLPAGGVMIASIRGIGYRLET